MNDEDFSYTVSGMLQKYKGSDSSVSIPDSVKKIGLGAFAGCKSLTFFSIPDGVTEINNYVFGECTSLASVKIPGSVTKIDDRAFQNCTSLKSVSISGGETKIGEAAFFGCTSLASIVISRSMKAIEDEAFGMWSKPFWNIRYEGTMEEWEAVYKAPDWNKKLSTSEVACSDGAVTIGYFTQSTALPGMEAGKDMSDDLGAGNGSAAVDSGNASGVTTEDVVLTERDRASTEPTSIAYPLKLHSDVNLVTVSRCDDSSSLASDSRVISRKPRYSIRKMGDGYYDVYIPDGNVSAHHCVIYKKT